MQHRLAGSMFALEILCQCVTLVCNFLATKIAMPVAQGDQKGKKDTLYFPQRCEDNCTV